VAERILFILMAPTAVISAYFMIRARNAVHGALLLVLNFFALAVLYVVLEAHFLAAVQVIVYAGAIMVLFLFVIMLLGVDREENPFEENIRFLRPIAGVVGLGFVGLLTWVLWSTFRRVPFKGLAQANAPGNVQALGRTLFTKYLFPFEVASVLLIIAAIGAMILGRRRDEEEQASMIGDATPPGRDIATPGDEP
jgi:NADH-quinone oxidoreductase subunit J